MGSFRISLGFERFLCMLIIYTSMIFYDPLLVFFLVFMCIDRVLFLTIVSCFDC